MAATSTTNLLSAKVFGISDNFLYSKNILTKMDFIEHHSNDRVGARLKDLKCSTLKHLTFKVFIIVLNDCVAKVFKLTNSF